MTNCYYYDEQRNRCNCYVNENLNELLAENAKLRKLIVALHRCAAGSLRDLAPSCIDISKEGCGMDCTDNGERCCMELLEQRMQELGIEVDA